LDGTGDLEYIIRIFHTFALNFPLIRFNLDCICFTHIQQVLSRGSPDQSGPIFFNEPQKKQQIFCTDKSEKSDAATAFGAFRGDGARKLAAERALADGTHAVVAAGGVYSICAAW